MKIPFVDLKSQYFSLKKDIDLAIESVIDRTDFIKGKEVSEFEKAFAELNGMSHCVGVANGTDAIYIILKMLGIGMGDEVITTSISWISTSETISLTGARPVFVDVEPDFFTIEPEKIEEKINAKTKAIIPVHLYGQTASIDKIKKIAEKHSLFMIEDCAQAHFAEFNGLKVGTFGTASSFSFYPGKNLGAYGDAGAILTNDDSLAQKVRMFANHGALKKHDHIIEGINSRLDTLQAAILLAKLPSIQQWNNKRLEHALYYNKNLQGIGDIITPSIRANTKHVFHLYVIRTSRRDELKSFLMKKGIETGIHYPTALPNLTAYSYLKHTKQDFPIASKYQDEILSLPMFPELTTDKINYIVESIREFFL